MSECRLSQEFTYIPNKVLGEGFDIYIRVDIRTESALSRIDKFLVMIYDEKQAQAFVSRLNKHWDDIYEIPRWCAKFAEQHMDRGVN